ncbi:uncharacterized protein EV154DRAFT_494906 [Mucor mucedo]|uniref:uncharacterized protein n=1 Tax=Mucor mucedo TaxID=29922 RepID=UPI00221E5F6A|nr:uncharacterized protein EV154DRAFT_494906 [Mucor mucedo]KAI7895788.1 hypothetical protein EV154DRAFT_494906 [Mucor mucedo]
MESDYNQDLPHELLEKLRNLELELEDGDITLKGFEKKKASLLAASNPTTPTSPHQKTDAEILEELGPEPSAADVVDFLDFLPSPTHSPVLRSATLDIGNTFMETSHHPVQPSSLPPPPVPLQQQQQQQQQQMYAHQQQSYPRPVQPQYRPYNTGRPMMNNGYYPVVGGSPLPNNRPPYPMRPIQQQQQQQQRPPPGSNPYYSNGRPPPSSQNYRPINTNYQQRPIIYNANPNIPPQQQQQTSPRPMYRPQPRPNNANYQNYRPQPQQQHQQQQQYAQPQYIPSSTANSVRNSELQYGNYAYNNTVNRSPSGNTGSHPTERQYQTMSMYSARSDSTE